MLLWASRVDKQEKVARLSELTSYSEAQTFLRDRGLKISEQKVRAVVNALRHGRARLRRFYISDKNDRGFLGKGTVYKIKQLLEAEMLEPYLAYLDSTTDNELDSEAERVEVLLRRKPETPLQQEAWSFCLRRDHEWFWDDRYEGLAYEKKDASELKGSSLFIRNERTCWFCGHST